MNASGGAGARRLVPVLALRDLVVVAAAAMGPAFSLATTMAAMVAAAGRWTWLALAIVAVLMTGIALGYKRLGERLRDAGSSYAWVRAAFGRRAGAYAAWVLLVANLFAVLATALPAGTYTLDLVAPGAASSPVAVALVACAWVAASAALLWYGLKPTALLAFALLAAEVAVLAVAAVVCAAHPRPDAVAFTGGAPTWTGLVGAIVVGVWMIDGWEVSASAAEEAEGAPSAPGWGGLAGLLLTTVVLLASILAFERVGSARGFSAHETDALAYVGGLLGGAWPVVLTVTVLVSLAASLQTTLVYLSRSIYGMGRDGLLPRALGELDARDEPAVAIAVVAAASLAFTLADVFSPTAKGAFDLALQGTSWFLGLLFVLTAAAGVRAFAGDRASRLTGAAIPGVAALLLAGVLAASLAGDDGATRYFIGVSAIIGLPLALWGGRLVHRSFPAGARGRTGSRF